MVWTSNLDRARGAGVPGRASNGVVITIVQAVPGGWSAIATHGSLVTKNCVIYVGEVANLPRLPLTLHDKTRPEQTGVPVCDKP